MEQYIANNHPLHLSNLADVGNLSMQSILESIDIYNQSQVEARKLVDHVEEMNRLRSRIGKPHLNTDLINRALFISYPIHKDDERDGGGSGFSEHIVDVGLRAAIYFSRLKADSVAFTDTRIGVIYSLEEAILIGLFHDTLEKATKTPGEEVKLREDIMQQFPERGEVYLKTIEQLSKPFLDKTGKTRDDIKKEKKVRDNNYDKATFLGEDISPLVIVFKGLDRMSNFQSSLNLLANEKIAHEKKIIHASKCDDMLKKTREFYIPALIKVDPQLANELEQMCRDLEEQCKSLPPQHQTILHPAAG